MNHSSSEDKDRMQNLWHEMLEIFFNGYRVQKRSLFLPYGNMMFNIRALVDEANGFLGRRASSKQMVSVEELAEVLADGFRILDLDLPDHRDEARTRSFQCRSADNFEKKAIDYDPTGSIERFTTIVTDLGIAGSLAGAWLHGSLGTGEAIVGYSDFDCFIIITREVAISARRLKQLRLELKPALGELYVYDPLQHHGFFVISEIDLRSYPNSYFPLDLLAYASSELISGKPSIAACLRNDDFERKQAFVRLAKTLINVPAKPKLKSAYWVKAYVQTIILLPTLYLQLKEGVYRFKRDTFELARTDFENEDWAIIEMATRLRKEWRYVSFIPLFLRRWIGSRMNPLVLSGIHRLESTLRVAGMERFVGVDYCSQGKNLAAKAGTMLAINLDEDSNASRQDTE